jgi:hypothetical protein
MEGLLLGTLSYYGNTINNKTTENKKYDSYNGNIEEKMNNIEKNQAQTSPEYFNQFDSLSFDNLSQPTAENISYTTRSGFNAFLQRDIDFHNGYSEFQNNDMHYNVVPKEEFVHNNMIPFTSRRETFINLDSNNRKYEQLSGNNSTWENKKEVEPFFDPVKDMNNVFGMPVMTEQLSQRYNPSLRNNHGNLPFQTDMKVAPGLDGKLSAPYAVHRVMPRNIDELRSEINKKISYKTKPLETIKKGELRAVESKITNFKLPSYREVIFNDLVPNRFHVDAPKKTGEFVHTDTERGMTDYDYMGGAFNPNKGIAQNIDNTHFNPAKRENYLNDFTHAINAVNTRPIFTNVKSYTNYTTDRSEISQELHATGAYNGNQSSYHNSSLNIAKPTMKQNNIIQDRNLGVNGPAEQKSYVFSNDFVLPQTHRETTNYDDVRNTAPTYQSGKLMLQDKAKPTIKETTINNTNIGNIVSAYQNINMMLQDTAKPTIKETTVVNNVVLNAKPMYEKGKIMLSDEAKCTIKQTTINSHGAVNIVPLQQNKHITLADIAKRTIRETTENNNYISNITSNYKSHNLMLDDEAKPTIKQTTIINSYMGNATSNVNANAAYLTDDAKPTIKETTLYSYNGNANFEQGGIYMKNNDEAKPTIRETTEVNNYIGVVSGDNNKESYTILQDEARPTIKQTTLDTTLKGQNIMANVPDSYLPNQDDVRVTIKQTTLLTNYKGGAKTNVEALRVEDAERNMCIDDKRQQTALGGRLPGAKSDKIRGNINNETVRFNDKRHTISYVSNPGTNKNYAVTPLTRKQTSKKTDLNVNTFYHVDPVQINTLNNNPLVNDIYHQKNIDFNSGI